MQLAVHVSRFPRDPATIAPVLAATARAADEGGVTTLTLMDHWFQMEPYGGPAEPMLDGYTALGFLAGQTSRVQLGLLVTGVTYRHPGLLAKTIATLDVLSGGRALLGIGAAWYDREHLGLGVPFPPLAERFERLEEALQVCAQMWGPDDGPYAGTHYDLAETVCVPAPLHRPRVLVGGSGERKTLRLVAQYADACNLFATDIAEVAHKLEVLDRHCADVGRDPAEVERTIVVDTDPLADPTAFLATMQEYAALGVAQVFVSPGGPDPARWVAEVCERLLPDLAALSAT
ncbi:MAG: LLM class F420-dependent oxidoreductase [Mycobacteriales bacterium]|nr:LLM class F420-dependent oxidoreductase [Mycobacteriales bacterium]